ncbi:GATA zinc finger domain-containing protein 1 [Puma concolor]|uniref:GATA zinc finger domain-containing protein 1 n=1 Tax=Puma concolor TaxID=9696 RepID=A0A6P6IDH1_PUMCO|nr:GATA zinc finger domain-containing protein 1 [Puma concolor]
MEIWAEEEWRKQRWVFSHMWMLTQPRMVSYGGEEAGDPGVKVLSAREGAGGGRLGGEGARPGPFPDRGTLLERAASSHHEKIFVDLAHLAGVTRHLNTHTYTQTLNRITLLDLSLLKLFYHYVMLSNIVIVLNGSSKQEIHRRSARLRNTKYKSAPAAEKKVSTKGKGRRHIFKLKNPIKAPESVSTIITAESIFYKGVYYQIGDVVSVIDEQDGKPYYAQIRGFIQDQYCEKSAALTWLIPTLSSPRGQFDPASYIIGPEEDLPRKMEYLEFVCHAPSEYFKSRSSPFPTVPTRPEKGYIWTHVGPTPAITIKETVANHL